MILGARWDLLLHRGIAEAINASPDKTAHLYCIYVAVGRGPQERWLQDVCRSLRFKTSVVQNVQKWSLVVCIVLLLPVVCLKGLTVEDFDRSLQCTALRRQCKTQCGMWCYGCLCVYFNFCKWDCWVGQKRSTVAQLFEILRKNVPWRMLQRVAVQFQRFCVFLDYCQFWNVIQYQPGTQNNHLQMDVSIGWFQIIISKLLFHQTSNSKLLFGVPGTEYHEIW